MLKHCTILKYSAQRARSFSDLLRSHGAHIEIETFGEDGLRFRTRQTFPSWHSLSAHEVTIKDTAGSGDWTSIGLLSALFHGGTPDIFSLTLQEISAAIEHGQAMAALNCKFEGAREAMYKMTHSAFLEAVRTIEENRPASHKERKLSLAHDLSTSLVCPSCTPKTIAADRSVRTQFSQVVPRT